MRNFFEKQKTRIFVLKNSSVCSTDCHLQNEPNKTETDRLLSTYLLLAVVVVYRLFVLRHLDNALTKESSVFSYYCAFVY